MTGLVTLTVTAAMGAALMPAILQGHVMQASTAVRAANRTEAELTAERFKAQALKANSIAFEVDESCELTEEFSATVFSYSCFSGEGNLKQKHTTVIALQAN